MCLYPITIRNRKYTSNKKNGGEIPAITDQRAKLIEVGCGNCIVCRKRKAREWKLRLIEDIKKHKNGVFVTLTFSDKSIKDLTNDINNYVLHKGKRVKTTRNVEGYVLDNMIAKRAMRLFNERWRKKYKTAIRHWMVTELGHKGTENVHLHGIMWTDLPKEQAYHAIEERWQYGHIWPNRTEEIRKTYVSDKTIGYITKYVTKKDDKHPNYNSIILTSSGIGANYLETHNSAQHQYKNTETKETYITTSGHKVAMPSYWRKKIYTDDQREKLWMNKLDEGKKYLMGDIIPDNLPEEDKNRIYNHYRKLNIRLGYGTDNKDQEKLEQERAERILKQKQRMARANNTALRGG